MLATLLNNILLRYQFMLWPLISVPSLLLQCVTFITLYFAKPHALTSHSTLTSLFMTMKAYYTLIIQSYAYQQNLDIYHIVGSYYKSFAL